MTNVLNILCESEIFDANDFLWSGRKLSIVVMSIAFMLFLFVGIAFLIYWLATTSFGRTALDDSRPAATRWPFISRLYPLAYGYF